ncbi:MAG: putative membrane protein [Parcubacteria group bacterium LiPW_15]|nr:MAG: putative membrane protein [Parcubacteria group bacterium LiPW_15]
MWLLYAFLAPAFYAVAEIFDEFLDNKEFKHPLTLIFYTSLFNLVFVPILFAFSPPALPPLHTIPIFILLGFVGVGYLYPYYRGLKVDDTSVVVSFFAISRVFIPVLAFLIVGEVLNFTQYAGILLVVVSVIALALHHAHKRFQFSKAMWYIGAAALLLAFEGIFLKLLFKSGVSVSTAIGGEAMIGLVLGVSVLISGKARKNIGAMFPLFVKLSPLFLLEELFTFLGQFTESSAISLTSISVVKGITMASPFFILVYAWIGHGFFPQFFKEDLHRKKVIKKLFLFLVLIAGIILIKE